MADDAAVVMTTTDRREDADRLAMMLVDRRLAACVQQLDIRSTYRWDGEIKTDAEILLLAKTTRSVADRAIETITAAHPYDTPEVLVVPVVAGGAAYLAWLASEVG